MSIIINSFRWDNQSATINAACRGGILDACEFILQESNKIVPHDEGILEVSGNISWEQTPTGFSAAVFYDTPYAIKVHEHPEYNFQNNREGKYLEKTVNRFNSRLEEYLRRRISLAMQRGGPI